MAIKWVSYLACLTLYTDSNANRCQECDTFALWPLYVEQIIEDGVNVHLGDRHLRHLYVGASCHQVAGTQIVQVRRHPLHDLLITSQLWTSTMQSPQSSENECKTIHQHLSARPPYSQAGMKKALRLKHCALAVVRHSQKFPLRGGAGWPKFNQLEMVTTFTYKPSFVRIDACNFELSS